MRQQWYENGWGRCEGLGAFLTSEPAVCSWARVESMFGWQGTRKPLVDHPAKQSDFAAGFGG